MTDEINQSLLPPNATKLLRDLESVFGKSFDLPALNRYVINPDLAPTHILPWLAWGLSVDDWNDEWSDEVKKNVIKSSIEVHRKKGTIGALKRALVALNYQNIKIEEWFQYSGKPYHFKVNFEVIEAGFDFFSLSEIERVVKNNKNVRSYLEDLKAYLTTKPALVSVGIILVSKDITELYPKIYKSDDFLTNQNLAQHLGVSFISKELTTLYPKKNYLESKAQDSFLGTFFITKEIVTINRKT